MVQDPFHTENKYIINVPFLTIPILSLSEHERDEHCDVHGCRWWMVNSMVVLYVIGQYSMLS